MKTTILLSIIIGNTLSLFIMTMSCNPARKIEKAEQLVRTTTPSFNKVGQEWNALHPCATDTFHKSKPDTIITPGDTLWHYQWVADTLNHHDTAYVLKTIYKNILIKDTAFLNDKQLLKIDVDSIGKLNREKSAANQNIVDLTAVVQKQDKEKDKWLWYFIGACVALAASNAFWLYSKFKLQI